MNNVMVRPTPVTVGGCPWPVLFTFQAWWQLWERCEGSMQGVITAATKGDQDMVATFLWAGLLHDNPGLTEEAVVDLLNGGSLAEVMELPAALVRALVASMPPSADEAAAGGKPWDWDLALAVWITEWGQDPDSFWALTFRYFAAFSNGRAKFYQQDDGGGEAEPVDVDPRDLIRNQRGR